MCKKRLPYILISTISLQILTGAFLVNTASAYWVWTPETKKFINPKYAVKDSPKEQFDWAMSFYDAKDYQRAAVEFEKLTKQYEYSEYASKAQYYIGLCYENMGKFYTAYQNYQKAIDNFPHIENLDEIIAREFNIAKMYAAKDSPKVLGTDIMTSLDRAVEIYRKVVDNAPYGKLADEAQFEAGVALKKSGMYDEAIQAFQKIVDDYPASSFVGRSQYELADCAYRSSLNPAYDVGPTDRAIEAFEEYAQANREQNLSEEIDKTVQRLKDKASEKSLMTARFYESQKHYESAIIYYQDILDRFPASSYVKEAAAKIEQLKERIRNPKGKKADVGEKAKKEPKIKKPWPPFGLGKKVEPKEGIKGDKEAVKEEAKPKKAWAPFKFEKKEAVKEEAKPKKAWAPFKFGKKKPAPKEFTLTQEAKVEVKEPLPAEETGAAQEPEIQKEKLEPPAPREESKDTNKEVLAEVKAEKIETAENA